MQDAPDLFRHYHEGFQQQTLGWPKQPVDVAAKWLSSLPQSLVVADFGCGDAKLMRTVKQASAALCKPQQTTFLRVYLWKPSHFLTHPVPSAKQCVAPHNNLANLFSFLTACLPQQKVHSFDLVSSAPGVIACNMADVPLEDGSVDVAVFSLALMGTDYGLFLQEARRVLKPKGWLWIAEVSSDGGRQSGPEGGRQLWCRGGAEAQGLPCGFWW